MSPPPLHRSLPTLLRTARKFRCSGEIDGEGTVKGIALTVRIVGMRAHELSVNLTEKNHSTRTSLYSTKLKSYIDHNDIIHINGHWYNGLRLNTFVISMKYIIFIFIFEFVSNFINITTAVCSRFNEISKRFRYIVFVNTFATNLSYKKEKKNFLCAAAVREM